METKETTFYLVRHGETKWNVEHRMQGHLNSDLTDVGIRQAETLRDQLKDVKFNRVLSSDLGRAVQTARIVLGDVPVQFITTPSLRERSYGPFEGMNIKEYQVAIKPQTDITNSLPPEERWAHRLAPGIETTIEVQNRFLGVIEGAAKKYTGEAILVSYHGSAIKYTVAKLGAFGLDDPKLIIANGCYVQIIHDGEKFRVGEMWGVKGR